MGTDEHFRFFLSKTLVLFLLNSPQRVFFLNKIPFIKNPFFSSLWRTHIFDYISGSILWAWVGYFPSGITLSLHIFFFCKSSFLFFLSGHKNDCYLWVHVPLIVFSLYETDAAAFFLYIPAWRHKSLSSWIPASFFFLFFLLLLSF